MIRKILIIGAFLIAPFSVPVSAGATGNDKKDEEGKVTICHRTNAVKNPYEQITIDKSAADGEGKDDHTQHTGPVASSEAKAQQLKDSKQKWGDIIPPFDGNPGLNWTSEGQAVYNNDCKYPKGGQGGNPEPEPEQPVTPTTGGQGGGSTLGTNGVAQAPSTPKAQPQVAKPAGAVNAGSANENVSVQALMILVAATAAAGYGAVRLSKN